jgi:hypothetical protein
VFFKMDRDGSGVEIRQEVLYCKDPETPKDLSFKKFTPELFVGMAPSLVSLCLGFIISLSTG